MVKRKNELIKKDPVNVFVAKGTEVNWVEDILKADVVISNQIGKFAVMLNEDQYILQYFNSEHIDIKYKGGQYLFEAIKIVLENYPNLYDEYILLKDIYPIIADKYDVMPKSVSREVQKVLRDSNSHGDTKHFIRSYKFEKIRREER